MNFLDKLFRRKGKTTSCTVTTLDSFVKGENFKVPCVVSLETSDRDLDSMLLLEGVRTIQFALIEVVPGTLSSHGADAETNPDREPMIGLEFFLPVTYSRHVTTLNKLYYRTRVQSIDEVKECIFSTVYACDGLRLVLKKSEPAFDPVRSIPIPKGTALQIVYEENDDTSGITVSDINGELYHVTEDNIKNMEVKNTRPSMSFKELVLSSPLPRAVQFNSVDQSDLATSLKEERDRLERALNGLIKVKSVKSFELIIGWRNIDQEHFEAMLIPFEAATAITVCPYSFRTPESEKAFIYNKFHKCNFDQIIGNRLYRKDLNTSRITSIQCSVLSSIRNEYVSASNEQAYEQPCSDTGTCDVEHRYMRALQSHGTSSSDDDENFIYADL